MVAGIYGSSINFNSQSITSFIQKLQDLKATMSANSLLNTETDQAIDTVIDKLAEVAQNPEAAAQGLTQQFSNLMSKIESGEAKGEYATGFTKKLSGIISQAQASASTTAAGSSSKTATDAATSASKQKASSDIMNLLKSGIESLGELRSILLILDEFEGILDSSLINSIESAIKDFVLDQAQLITNPEEFQSMFSDVVSILNEFGFENFSENLINNDDIIEMVSRLFSGKVENPADVLTSNALIKVDSTDTSQTLVASTEKIIQTIAPPAADDTAAEISAATHHESENPHIIPQKNTTTPAETHAIAPVPKSVNPDLMGPRPTVRLQPDPQKKDPQTLFNDPKKQANTTTAANQKSEGKTVREFNPLEKPITGFSGQKISKTLQKNQDINSFIYASSAAAATFKTRRELEMKDRNAAEHADLLNKPKLNAKNLEESIKKNPMAMAEGFYMLLLLIVQARLENSINDIEF